MSPDFLSCFFIFSMCNLLFCLFNAQFFSCLWFHHSFVLLFLFADTVTFTTKPVRHTWTTSSVGCRCTPGRWSTWWRKEHPSTKLRGTELINSTLCCSLGGFCYPFVKLSGKLFKKEQNKTQWYIIKQQFRGLKVTNLQRFTLSRGFSSSFKYSAASSVYALCLGFTTQHHEGGLNFGFQFVWSIKKQTKRQKSYLFVVCMYHVLKLWPFRNITDNDRLFNFMCSFRHGNKGQR